jgi:hypothetical protein
MIALSQRIGTIKFRQRTGKVAFAQRKGLVTFTIGKGEPFVPPVYRMDFTEVQNSQYINIIF